MRDILKFYGHDYTEDMVFGLGVGIGFTYFKHPEMVPPIYIGGRIYNLEQLLSKNLGFELEMVEGIDNEQAWLEVKNLLDRGIPTMVHADVYYLDYLRAKRHFSTHRIVLVGYDEERGVAFVADNDRDTIQECSLENLEKARSSAWLPQPANNAYYIIRVPQKLEPLERAIPRALEKAVKYNLTLPIERARFASDGRFIAQGLPGLQEFAESVPKFTDSMDCEMLTLVCKNIYVSAEKAGTGYGGNFRRMFGRFLKQSSDLLGKPDLEAIGKRFIEIGDRWTELSLALKENSSEPKRALSIASPIALDIYEAEKSAFSSLQEISESM